MNDTPSIQAIDLRESMPFIQEHLQQALSQEYASSGPSSPRRRGAPMKIGWMQLWMTILVSVLLGMKSYQDLWRNVCSQFLCGFAPIALSDDALVKRLQQAGTGPLERVLARVGAQLSAQLAALPGALPKELAPFATRIVDLDESTWDAIERHLPALRGTPEGSPRLLPGKLAARFDVRTQQWDWVQFRSDAQANCKASICSLLWDLPVGSLLTFDLGYFSFPWFDYLTELHYWFVTRLREKTCYRLEHVFYRHEGILDALVWLGSPHGARAGRLVRLVRFYDGTQLRSYLTNVLDPRQLSLPDIARLYARRWDIELAFLTLKEHLQLHHWWSAHQVLMRQQVLIALILAQLLQALRLQMAAEANCDPFEISLPLLVQYVPRFILKGQSLREWLQTLGRDLHLIRPASRVHLIVPEIALAELLFPPPDLKQTCKARYLEYVHRPGYPSATKKRTKARTKEQNAPAVKKPTKTRDTRQNAASIKKPLQTTVKEQPLVFAKT